MLTERQALDHDRIAQILGSEHRVLSRDESSNLMQALHSGGKAAMLTDAQLREIEATVKLSAAGPWIVDGRRIESAMENEFGESMMTIYDEGGHGESDARFIANSRTWVPQLLAMVRELQETIVALDRMVREQQT